MLPLPLALCQLLNVRGLLGLLALAILLGAASTAQAQSRTRVWDIALGIPVDQLPLTEFVNPACGTNGGPPSLRLDGFADFGRCPIDRATGLREVWFVYDDEWEYIARAQRDPREIARYSANVFARQPIVTSLLIDASALVQGYRVVSDPRAPVELRLEAHVLAAYFKSMFGDPTWSCVDFPREPRELPLYGVYIKTNCTAITGDRYLKVDTRHLLKPGQDARDVVRPLDEAIGDFESWSRLEVYTLTAVRDAPCCPR